MKDKLENILDQTKGHHLSKQYYLYSDEVQQMVKNVYNAVNRMNLYNSQIVYILDQALEPFKKEKLYQNSSNKFKQSKTRQICKEDQNSINILFELF